MSEIINLSMSLGGATAGIYGAIRAWLSNRKMRQIEIEKLSTKLDVDFNYELFSSNGEKICRGVISLSNLGLANIKIIKLNIDISDREEEMRRSYKPPETNPESSFTALSHKVENLELVAINNHKYVNFSNDLDNRLVRIFQDDPMYGLEISSKQRRELKDSGEDIEIDTLKIKKNILNYVDKKVARLEEIFSNGPNKDKLKKFLFHDTIVKDLRGIQLFPEEERNQEFFIRYKGEGMVYVNVESATIRLLLKNIEAIEKFKLICDDILDLNRLTDDVIKKFKRILKSIITPAALELHKQKSNYLLYLK